MPEIIYEECDDDGNSLSRSRSKPAWMKIPEGYKDLLMKAFALSGRKSFGDPREAKNWRSIVKSLEKGKMSEAWVENCIEWARKTNEEKGRLAIRFFALESAILNIVKQQEWEAQNQTTIMFEKDHGEIEVDDEGAGEIDV